MSPNAAPPLDIDAFLDRLHDDGYGVGVRERLLAHALLARFAESGGLPADLAERLRLLEPLLSRNEQEQRRFNGIVSAYLRQPRGVRTRDTAGEARPRGARAQVRRRVALLGLALIATAALISRLPSGPKAPAPAPAPPPLPAPADTTTILSPTPSSSADTAAFVSPIYVPMGSFPDSAEVAPASASPWGAALRWGLGGFCAILVLGLLAWLVERHRRIAYLQGVRTDEELDEHVLRDPDPVALPVPDGAVRPASRMLRQRVAGSREVLDLPATLQATMRAGGAMAARYRPLRQTPEYLVLVDRVSARDHQAAFHELLVGALGRYGVAVDLFYYDGSPARGCWRPQAAHDEDDSGGGVRALASVAQLANRYGGHRLLVFGDAACAFEPLSGQPAAWVRDVAPFASRAWFSPLPVVSWSAAEAGVDGLGFLLLPAQPEALESLGEWLASDRATLRVDEDWPGVYPPSLRANAAAWVARQTTPPPEAEEDLLYELRGYLGPVRFQWLCACAVFPAVSWPLTLSLGRELLSGSDGPADPAALARGIAALGALPWFRYGRMPAWLRESLLDRVDPEQEARLRGVVERRLAVAMADGPGITLAEVAVRRRMAAWFARRRGMARDVVLADFLEKGLPQRLAQRMPKPLQRLLFRDGKALYGLRPGVPAVAALAAMLSCVAVMPGVWEAWAGGIEASTNPIIDSYAELGGDSGIVTSAVFSPDGQRVLTTSNDGTARVWRADGTDTPVVLKISVFQMNAAAFSPDGRLIVTASPDEAVQVWRADGTGTPLVLQDHADRSWRTTFISISPDGERVAAAFQDTAVKVWRTDGLGVPAVLRHGARVNSAAFSPDGQRIVTASDDHTVRVWRSDGLSVPMTVLEFQTRPTSGALVEFRHSGPVSSAAFSPDGRHILTVAGDTVRVWWADGTGTSLAFAHSGPVASAVFSPDGKRIVTASPDGPVRVWKNGVMSSYGSSYAAFSPDGQRIVTIREDTIEGIGPVQRAQVWRAKGRGAPIKLDVFSQGHRAAFSPDGERIVTSGVSMGRLWGRRPGVAVNIMGCAVSEAPYAAAHRLADRLARDTALAPVAYALPAWDTARLGPVPDAGEVRYRAGSAQSRAAADALIARLDTLSGTGTSLRWTAVGAAMPEGTLSVGVCPSAAGSRTPADLAIRRMVFRAPVTRGIKEVVLHHTGDPAREYRGASTFRALQRYFREVENFSEFPYHYAVAPTGEVFEGQPLGRPGTHVTGHNRETVGIVLMLDGNAEDPTPAQRTATAQLLRALFDRFHIAPEYNFSPGHGLHRELDSSTERSRTCPGRRITRTAALGWLADL